MVKYEKLVFIAFNTTQQKMEIRKSGLITEISVKKFYVHQTLFSLLGNQLEKIKSTFFLHEFQ